MKIRKGFTLIELLIVVVLLAILAAFIISNYRKTIEDNRARNAVKILRMLGSARRMQLIDNGNAIVSQYINNSMFQNVTCPQDIDNINQIGHLQACGYGDLKSVDWDGNLKYYVFFSCSGNNGPWCCSGSHGAPPNVIACAVRHYNYAPNFSKYWIYFYTEEGQCIGKTRSSTSEIPPCTE
jgi:prepilin-type N-terminal cleavage/methylation domain-containing protein